MVCEAMPEVFVQVTLIVYTRPLPEPIRSARRFTVSGPVIHWSSVPGSLLAVESMRQSGDGSPVAVTCNDTGTIL